MGEPSGSCKRGQGARDASGDRVSVYYYCGKANGHWLSEYLPRAFEQEGRNLSHACAAGGRGDPCTRCPHGAKCRGGILRGSIVGSGKPFDHGRDARATRGAEEKIE